jgi:hypothetical protein
MCAAVTSPFYTVVAVSADVVISTTQWAAVGPNTLAPTNMRARH